MTPRPTACPRLLWTWPEVAAEVGELMPMLNGFADVDSLAVDQAELATIIADYDILVPRLSHTVNEDILARALHLKLIGTPSTGSDHIAVAAAKQRGIATLTLKDDRAFLDSVQATAEHAWLLILACHRRLREALAQVQHGGWDAQALRGQEMIGRTLGIVGYGRLGTMVSRFANAFRMPVIATDPYLRIDDPWVEQVPFEELLARADIITLHVHLNDETRGMLNRSAFAKMKRGVILVNTSRGGVIDEPALLDALRSGTVAAAGLDVIDGERDPARTQRPLLRYATEHDHLILTPHIGGCTEASQAKAFLRLAERLRDTWANTRELV